MASDPAWRERLIAACERTLADLKTRKQIDLSSRRLIPDIEDLRDRLLRERDADRGPSRGGEVTPLEDPSVPTDGK